MSYDFHEGRHVTGWPSPEERFQRALRILRAAAAKHDKRQREARRLAVRHAVRRHARRHAAG